MPARLRAGDRPVPIVVVERERITPAGRSGRGAGPRGGKRRADDGLERRALATEGNALKRLHLAPVDGEPVRKADLDDLTGEPAPVPPGGGEGDPLRGILRALLMPAHAQGGECEIPDIAGGAETAASMGCQ